MSGAHQHMASEQDDTEEWLDLLAAEAGPGAAGRMPTELLQDLTEEQREAVNELLAYQRWSRHPVDIRLSVPTLRGRAYLTVVAGWERRHNQRRSLDRDRFPVLTANNLLFLLGGGVAVFMVALLALEFVHFVVAG